MHMRLTAGERRKVENLHVFPPPKQNKASLSLSGHLKYKAESQIHIPLCSFLFSSGEMMAVGKKTERYILSHHGLCFDLGKKNQEHQSPASQALSRGTCLQPHSTVLFLTVKPHQQLSLANVFLQSPKQRFSPGASYFTVTGVMGSNI